MLNIIRNPKIRSDRAGDGHYLAKRGERFHRGVDYIVEPGEEIYMPFDGYIAREAYPYRNDYEFKGILIQGKSIALKIFYMEPILPLVGSNVKAGTVIGYAQDVRKKYPNEPDMQSHVHIEIADMDVNLLMGKL